MYEQLMQKLADKIRSYQHWPDRKKQGDKLLPFTESKEFVFFLADMVKHERWEYPAKAATFLSAMDWGYKGYCACVHIFIQYILHQKEDYQSILAVLEHTTDKAVDVVMNDLPYDNRYQMLRRIYTSYKNEKTFPSVLLEKFKVVPDGKLAFRLIDNETAYEVEAYCSLTCGHVIIPATYNGKPVKKIANNGFANANIASIELPEGIEVIGRGAFYCKRIKEVKFPQSLKSIEKHAFEMCDLKGTIIIPKNVTHMGELVFHATRLTNILVDGEKPTDWDKNWCGNNIDANDITVTWNYKNEATL